VPITSSAVHRADDANVVLGEPVMTSSCFDVPLLTPPSGHFLLRHGECNYAVEELIEAGRQLATAAGHESHGRAADSRLLWLGLTAELPPAMLRSVPLALRWPVCPPHGALSLFDFTVVTRAGHRPVGSLSYAIKSYPSAAYAGMRDKGSRAA
jgi:hypothetical protein